VETNEKNNLDLFFIDVTPGNVDLVITSFELNDDSTSPVSVVRASSVKAEITVKNNGTYPSNFFAVRWLLRDSDKFGPTQFVNGLNPGESRTLTFESSYFVAGDFTSKAIVDVNNNVIESNENNNDKTLSVTVQPRKTTLRVTLNGVKVLGAGEDGIDGNAEWDPVVWALLDPSASCNFLGQTINSIRCDTFDDQSVEDGDTIGSNRSMDVTLVESTPLVVAITGYEEDDPLLGEFIGFAFKVMFSNDYLGEPTFTLAGDKANSLDGIGSVCGGAHCFDATFKVTVLSAPPALAAPAGIGQGSLTAEQQAILDQLITPPSGQP
jgi:hypothetical protein